MTDEKIIELFFHRDEQAIRESVIAYGAYCRSIAAGILSDPSDAEEAVADTWLAAWDSIPPNRPKYLRLFLGSITVTAAQKRITHRNADLLLMLYVLFFTDIGVFRQLADEKKQLVGFADSTGISCTDNGVDVFANKRRLFLKDLKPIVAEISAKLVGLAHRLQNKSHVGGAQPIGGRENGADELAAHAGNYNVIGAVWFKSAETVTENEGYFVAEPRLIHSFGGFGKRLLVYIAGIAVLYSSALHQRADEIAVVGSDICGNRTAAHKGGGSFEAFVKVYHSIYSEQKDVITIEASGQTELDRRLACEVPKLLSKVLVEFFDKLFGIYSVNHAGLLNAFAACGRTAEAVHTHLKKIGSAGHIVVEDLADECISSNNKCHFNFLR